MLSTSLLGLLSTLSRLLLGTLGLRGLLFLLLSTLGLLCALWLSLLWLRLLSTLLLSPLGLRLLLRALGLLLLTLLSLRGLPLLPLLLGLLCPLGLRLLGLTILLLGRASLVLPLLVLGVPTALFLLVALSVVLCMQGTCRTNEQSPEKQGGGRSCYSREIHVIAPSRVRYRHVDSQAWRDARRLADNGRSAERSESEDTQADHIWSADHGSPPPQGA